MAARAKALARLVGLLPVAFWVARSDQVPVKSWPPLAALFLVAFWALKSVVSSMRRRSSATIRRNIKRLSNRSPWRACRLAVSDRPARSGCPGQAYQINSLVCRDYTHTVYIQGQPEVLTGTACRQPDGTWRNVG
jgi:hypothetical protein